MYWYSAPLTAWTIRVEGYSLNLLLLLSFSFNLNC
nr:MAG TPA: hypothetical protein [Caudoviricetes sp.]